MDITLLMTMCTSLISFVHHISGIIKEGRNEGMSERKKYNRKKKKKRGTRVGEKRGKQENIKILKNLVLHLQDLRCVFQLKLKQLALLVLKW